jgi:hypothetical protein
MGFIKNADRFVKFSPPWGHFYPDRYDGDYSSITNIRFPSCMIGCSADKADAVRFELSKMVREDRYTRYYELNPFDLHQ